MSRIRDDHVSRPLVVVGYTLSTVAMYPDVLTAENITALLSVHIQIWRTIVTTCRIHFHFSRPCCIILEPVCYHPCLFTGILVTSWLAKAARNVASSGASSIVQSGGSPLCPTEPLHSDSLRICAAESLQLPHTWSFFGSKGFALALYKTSCAARYFDYILVDYRLRRCLFDIAGTKGTC